MTAARAQSRIIPPQQPIYCSALSPRLVVPDSPPFNQLRANTNQPRLLLRLRDLACRLADPLFLMRHGCSLRAIRYL